MCQMTRFELGYDICWDFLSKLTVTCARIGGPLKIRLLQCYEVLWIHNIDAICSISRRGFSIDTFVFHSRCTCAKKNWSGRDNMMLFYYSSNIFCLPFHFKFGALFMHSSKFNRRWRFFQKVLFHMHLLSFLRRIRWPSTNLHIKIVFSIALNYKSSALL